MTCCGVRSVSRELRRGYILLLHFVLVVGYQLQIRDEDNKDLVNLNSLRQLTVERFCTSRVIKGTEMPKN